MLDIIDTAWVKLKIAFNVQDQLQVSERSFELPENLKDLEPALKQRLIICNLFANLSQSIDQVADYLSVSRNDVISVLIDEGLLKEQRKRHSRVFRHGRREADRSGSDSLPIHGEFMNR